VVRLSPLQNQIGGIEMNKIKTFDNEMWIDPEKREQIKLLGLDTTLGVFQALKAHLEEVGLLPDGEFRPVDPEPMPMPFYSAAHCCVNFSEPDGVFFVIYLDTYGPGKSQECEFAVGNTEGSTAEDYMRMCRIAAECSLMFNGQGREFEIDYKDFEQDSSPELAM